MTVYNLAKLVAEYRHACKEAKRTDSKTAKEAEAKLEARLDHVLACLAEEQKTLRLFD